MFPLRKKLDVNLKSCLNSKNYNNYRVLIKYKNFKDKICKRIKSYKGEIINCIDSCNLICTRINSKGISRLIEYPEIEYVCFDDYLYLCGMSLQTANKVKINSKNSYTGKGIGIGLIDTGVYPHQDLIRPFNRIKTFVDVIDGLKYPYDDNGHGTSVAGILAGNGSLSNGMYQGVAPNADLHCYKAFDKVGHGFISDVLFSIENLINISEEHNIKVICMPFELLKFDIFFINCFNILISACVSKNISIVVPSGSSKNLEGSITGFANNKNCITVSGVNTKGIITPYEYSSSGTIKKPLKPDFCAACCDIVSLNCNPNFISEKNNIKQYPTKLDVSYKTYTGTSYSAAYIAGLCALLYEQNHNYTAQDIKSLLSVASEQIPDIDKNVQGLGKININKVLK